MLKIKNVSKTFNIGTINEKKALKNINLELNDGDFVTINTYEHDCWCLPY